MFQSIIFPKFAFEWMLSLSFSNIIPSSWETSAQLTNLNGADDLWIKIIRSWPETKNKHLINTQSNSAASVWEWTHRCSSEQSVVELDLAEILTTHIDESWTHHIHLVLIKVSNFRSLLWWASSTFSEVSLNSLN